jgi:hypothetical protein
MALHKSEDRSAPTQPPSGFGSVSTALNGLRRVKARQAEFDYNFNGHTPAQPLPDGVLDDCIACMEGILDGTIVKQVVESPFGGKQEAALFGRVMITYDENHLYD